MEVGKKLQNFSKGSGFKAQSMILNSFSNIKALGHVDRVTGIVVSPKCDSLFTSSRNGEIIQWSLSGQRKVRVFTKVRKMVVGLEITHDEEFLVACSPPEGIFVIRIRQSEGSVEMESLPFTEGAVIMKLSKDSEYLAFNCKDYTVTVINFRLKTKARVLLLGYPEIKGLGFLYNPEYLVYFTPSNQLVISDFKGNETESITTSNTITCMACGKILNQFALGLTDNSIVLYQYNPTKRTSSITEHLSFIVLLEFSENDQFLVSSSYDKTIRVFSLGNSGNMTMFKVVRCNSSALSFSFTSDLRKIYLGFDLIKSSNLVKCFDLNKEKFEPGFNGHSSLLRRIVFIKDYKEVLTDAFDGTLRVWDCKTGAQLALIAPIKVFECFALAQNENLIVFGCQDTLVVWNIEMNTEKFRVRQEFSSRPNPNMFILQNKFLAFQNYGLFILDLDSKEIRELVVNRNLTLNSQLKIDEEHLISNYEGGKIIFWKISEQMSPLYEFDSRHRMSNVSSKFSKKYLVISLKSRHFAVFNFKKIKLGVNEESKELSL